jgi:hypothetical protein
VVEGSLVGETWTEIDRKMDNIDLSHACNTTSFTLSNSAEYRCIRLTHTGEDRSCGDYLDLGAFEVFEALFGPYQEIVTFQGNGTQRDFGFSFVGVAGKWDLVLIVVAFGELQGRGLGHSSSFCSDPFVWLLRSGSTTKIS